jgi:hypothetical protein
MALLQQFAPSWLLHQIGQRLETGYEPQARARAAELAEHFVRGRDLVRAVKHLSYAGEQAVQRSAPHEAMRHLTQAIELLAMALRRRHVPCWNSIFYSL